MNSKQRAKRNKALRHQKNAYINPDDLAPGLAAGLTQGPEALKEANERFPVTGRSGLEMARDLKRAEDSYERGQPQAPFVASEDADSVWLDEPTGRLQKNAVLTFPKHIVREFQAGYRCLRCHERQDEPFPPPERQFHLDGCAYPMHDRQILDFAMEFEGDKHLGPSRPISEFLQEQELRREKRRFIKQKLDGGGGKIPKEWLRDAVLLDGLSPDDRKLLGA